MTSLPLVSVMIITYNQKHFIADCMESIINQDYPEVEIIVADDCSTDGTQDIARAISKKYPSKRIILNFADTNQGITRNCNAGLACCSGALFCMTGGDDIFLPGKISSQVNWFLQNPEGSICTTDIEVFDSATNKPICIIKSREFMRGGPVKKIITQKNQPPSSNFMVNMEKCGDIRFDERTPVVSDWLYVIRCCTRGKIGYVNGLYLRYRRHEQNTTSPVSKRSYLDDRLLNTDLLVTMHPEFYRSCRIQRANIFFEEGKRHFFLKDFRTARLRSAMGMMEYFFDFRNLALYISSLSGNFFLKLADWIKRKKHARMQKKATIA